MPVASQAVLLPRRPALHAGMARLLVAMLAAVLLSACPSVSLSPYDPVSYATLTELKAEAMTLVESFDSKTVADNDLAIEALLLELRKAREYELGKGPPNADTVAQFDLVKQLFTDAVAEYRDSGPGSLGTAYFQQAARSLGQAFDTVIATENLKNRR